MAAIPHRAMPRRPQPPGHEGASLERRRQGIAKARIPCAAKGASAPVPLASRGANVGAHLPRIVVGLCPTAAFFIKAATPHPAPLPPPLLATLWPRHAHISGFVARSLRWSVAGAARHALRRGAARAASPPPVAPSGVSAQSSGHTSSRGWLPFPTSSYAVPFISRRGAIAVQVPPKPIGHACPSGRRWQNSGRRVIHMSSFPVIRRPSDSATGGPPHGQTWPMGEAPTHSETRPPLHYGDMIARQSRRQSRR